MFYGQCLSDEIAIVTEKRKEQRKLARPMPMNTIELETIAFRAFQMSAKQALTVAERLYSKGLIVM